MAKETALSASRRNDIVSAAVAVFAEIGYYRATTAQVAERASISQPYVYRFFTKESLLVAALDLSWERIIRRFREVEEAEGPERLEAGFIRAYEEIMESHRNEILLQMQAYTIGEPAVRDSMQRGIGQVKELVTEAFRRAGIGDVQRRTADFLARGMLCNAALALDMPRLMDK